MRAIIVAGLGFGDEGKGRTVHGLTKHTGATLVVRYNGGAQAAHHVTFGAYSHCFSQLGAGTFAGAATYLSQYVTVDLPALDREAAHLREFGMPDPFLRLTVHLAAPLVTPWHRALNQLKEISRGAAKHGSCGRGIGEVQREICQGREPIVMDDCRDLTLLSMKAHEVRLRLLKDAEDLGLLDIEHPAVGVLAQDMRQWAIACYDIASRLRISWRPYGKHETIIFEGAQGVLLDEMFGFHPHTTWSDTTYRQAEKLIREFCDHQPEITRVGVIRSYLTRHGAGPLPTEDATLRRLLVNEHNAENPWQGEFRVGHFDSVLLRYALSVCKTTDVLALTHLDKVESNWMMCNRYAEPSSGVHIRSIVPVPVITERRSAAMSEVLKECRPVYQVAPDVATFVQMVQEETQLPVGIEAYGPHGHQTRDFYFNKALR